MPQVKTQQAAPEIGTASAELRLADLVILPELQVRSKTDQATVRRYAQAMKNGAVFPPIAVAAVDGVLLLIDGFHRVEAARAIGQHQLTAEVALVRSRRDARWLAAKANLTHGLHLRPKERRAVLAAYVGARQHRQGSGFKSYRAIAAELGGLAHATVRNWMRQDFPSVFTAMSGQDGGLDARGGLPEPESTEVRLWRAALEDLDAVAAMLPGVTDPRNRWVLLDKVEALRKALEDAGVVRPDF